MGSGFLLAWLVWASRAPQPAIPGPVAGATRVFTPPAGAATRPGTGRRLLTDLGVAAAGTLTIATLKPDIRQALSRDARFSNVVRNFSHPIEQVRIGTRRDRDPFWVNGVAHPGLFALEALYLKRRGHSDVGAFVFTQAHNLLWEFAVEGSAFEPSGKDLVADAAGAAAGIWLLRPLAERSARRLEQGRGRTWDHALRWLDPVSVLARHRAAPVVVTPVAGRLGVGLQLTASF